MPLHWIQTQHLQDRTLKIWYEQFNLRQIRIHRGCQPLVDFEGPCNCRLYVTTMKARNFPDDIPSIHIHNSIDLYVLVFDLTSMQNATESCHYLELIGEPLRLGLNFIFPLEHVSELINLGDRMSSIAVDDFGVVGRISKMDDVSLQQTFHRINYRYRSYFPSVCVPTLDNDNFAIIITLPTDLQGEHLMKFANTRHKLSLADSLERPSFFNQQCKEMVPEPLQLHPNISGFSGNFAAFHLEVPTKRNYWKSQC